MISASGLKIQSNAPQSNLNIHIRWHTFPPKAIYFLIQYPKSSTIISLSLSNQHHSLPSKISSLPALNLPLLPHALTFVFNVPFLSFILPMFNLSASQSLMSFIICLFSRSKVSFFTTNPTKFNLILSQSESSIHWGKKILLHPTYVRIKFFLVMLLMIMRLRPQLHTPLQLE